MSTARTTISKMSSHVAINFQQAMTITAMQHLLACKYITILIATKRQMFTERACWILYYASATIYRSFKQNQIVALINLI